MGYEHRNGEMPDHVNQDDNNSDPQYGHQTIDSQMSDSTKKAAPVDTTAIKGRISRDTETAQNESGKSLANQIMSSGLSAANLKHDDYDAAKKAADKNRDAASNRIAANSDTLAQARAGKIPAKP